MLRFFSRRWQDASSGETRIGIFSTRDVEPGEELTYDYSFQDFGVKQSFKYVAKPNAERKEKPEMKGGGGDHLPQFGQL